MSAFSLHTGGGLDFSALQEQLRALPLEGITPQEMRAISAGLLPGIGRASEAGQQEQEQDEKQEEEHEKPWPLQGVMPYYNPYLPKTQQQQNDEEEMPVYGKVVPWVGSVTGTVPCATGAAGVIVAPPPALLDRSHWGALRWWGGGIHPRLLVELPRMFTTLYKQVRAGATMLEALA